MPGRRASVLGLTITDRELSTRGEFRGARPAHRARLRRLLRRGLPAVPGKAPYGFRCHANTGIRFPETA